MNTPNDPTQHPDLLSLVSELKRAAGNDVTKARLENDIAQVTGIFVLGYRCGQMAEIDSQIERLKK